MADTGTEFLSFLKANYPEDYSKLSSDAVSDALVNAVFTKHQEQFDIWKRFPNIYATNITDEFQVKLWNSHAPTRI